jgi:hypothetical protein
MLKKKFNTQASNPSMPYLRNNSAFCFIWNINALTDSHAIIEYRVGINKKKVKMGQGSCNPLQS